MVVDNIAVTADRCMEAIREHVGTVELGAFIYSSSRNTRDFSHGIRA